MSNNRKKGDKTMDRKDPEEIRTAVRKSYGALAKGQTRASEACGSGSCCGPVSRSVEERSAAMGYSKEEIESVPQGANMGLGCGNPGGIASLKPGETVLDLGSGGGFDCLLAAKYVGSTGRIIGVDMTPDMVSTARENAKKAGVENAEFRLGEIEHLPAEDQSVDVILSNCVINLSPEKEKVFKEAFRVLRPGGRLAISDVVATSPLPSKIQKDLSLITACVGGALDMESLRKVIETVGFQEIRITPIEGSRRLIQQWLPGKEVENYIVSATIEATKPAESKVEISSRNRGSNEMESKEIRKRAYGHFESGLHCAEVVYKTILEMFLEEPDPRTLRVASGFGGGIAGSTEELCGAFTGGVIAIGHFLGRRDTGDDLRDCGALTREFKTRFKEEFGSLTCSTILKSFREQENPIGCVKLTATATAMLAHLLNEFEDNEMLSLHTYWRQSREKVKVGSCPFSAGTCQA